MKFNIDFGKVNFDDINIYKSLLENNSLKNHSSQSMEEINYSNYDNVNNIDFDIDEGKIEAIKMDEERRKREAEEKRKKEEEERKKEEEERKKIELELENLYKARDDNNGFFHPNKEAEIEAEILKLEKKLGVPHQPDGWETFCDTAEDVGATAVTFVASSVEGVVDVGETIVDGTVQVVGGAAAYTVGAFNEEAGQAMKDGIKDFVSYDASGALYDGFVDMTGIDEDIAYGWAHTAGNVTGQVAGYAAITAFTGGAGTVLLSGAAAAGSSAETAYASGASFDEAMIASTANAALGMAGGAAMNKVNTFAKGATTLKGVAGYTAAGAGIGAAEPLANTVVEYATYGNNDGKSYMEYMQESGGWTKVAMGASAGGLSTGAQSFKGYSNFKYEEKVTTLRNSSIDYYQSQRAPGSDLDWIDDAQFNEKLAKADAAAIQLEKDGIMRRDKFYEVWGTERGKRPDPTTYLSKKYIKKHLAMFEAEGASRLVDGDTYIQRVASNGGMVGNPGKLDALGNPSGYDVGNVHYDYSEFLTTKSSVDKVIESASKSTDFEASVVKDLGLTDYELNKYKNSGIKRYNVSGDNLSDLRVRVPSGNEPGAFLMDWVPGAKTSGGMPEVIVDNFRLTDSGNELITIK